MKKKIWVVIFVLILIINGNTVSAMINFPVITRENQNKKNDILAAVKRPAILMYHKIADSDYHVTAENFEKQMKYLSENGYTALFPEEIFYSDNYEKPILITFDDGYVDNYTYAFPILQKYNMKAAIFIITDSIGKKNFLAEEQIKTMADSGFARFYPHTHSHSNLAGLTPDEMRIQIETSNAVVEKLTGRSPRVTAYPYGSFNDEVKMIARDYYDMAFATWYGGQRDMLALYRASVYNDMEEFKKNTAVTFPEFKLSGESYAARDVFAVPSSSKIFIDGKDAELSAYNINGSNYFNLRDLAYVLNGTKKQFEIVCDETNNIITLTAGKAYAAAGGEMAAITDKDEKIPSDANAKIYLDGEEISLIIMAYNIDGNNYFRLRDIGRIFDFNVDWDKEKNIISINTSEKYKNIISQEK